MTCLGLCGHLRSLRKLLIAPKPLAAHRPRQRYPHRHVLVGGVEFDVRLGIDVCHRDPASPL